MSNVLINGRTAVHADSKGTLATVDICLTKVGPSLVPIPYPNIAKSEDADNTAATVFINGQPACHADSIFSVSTGNQPGSEGGIKSGVTEGQAEFITSSPNVFIEGIAAVRMGDLMISNEGNTPPAPLMQPGAPLPPELKAAALKEASPPAKTVIDIAVTHQSKFNTALLQSTPPAQNNSPKKDSPTGIQDQQNQHSTEETKLKENEQLAKFGAPVLINLRNDAPTHASQKLSQEQLDYFKENGNNALIFVHGYGVALGEFGRSAVSSSIPRNMNINLSDYEKEFKPYPYNDLPNLVYRPLVEVPPTYYPFSEKAVNGSGAHSWLLNMEYQLNCAAGYLGHDQHKEPPYQRIIGIAWSGDVWKPDFYRATLNAQVAGRRLAITLIQLIEAGITVNLMSHSLGAKVILTALNILAETHQKAIDHVFLWQPAVADNALSNKVENDTHPFGAGVLPQAHKAAKHFIVLHSSKDGVLDGHDTTENLFEDINNGNLSEAMTGLAGGAYRKKWWDITLFKAGIKTVLGDLYANYGALHISELDQGIRYNVSWNAGSEEMPTKKDRTNQEQKLVNDNWKRLENDLKKEMQDIQGNLSYKKHSHKIPEYRLLAPIAINRVLDEQAVDQYIKRLKAYYNDKHKASPRPALGYRGLSAIRLEDQFINDRLIAKDFEEVDQVKWLFDHSGMKIPSKELFDKVYVDEIWQRLKTKSKFGQYS